MQGSPRSFLTLFAALIWLCAPSLTWGLDAATKLRYAQTPFKVVDVSEMSYDNAPALGVTFSVPVEANSGFGKYLNVSLKNGSRVEGGWILSDSGTTAYFTHIEPEKQYTVTVYQGLLAVTGVTLAQTLHDEVKTRPLQSSVAFASNGFVLPASNSKGLPLYTVNIAEVDVDFHRVRDDRIPQFLNNWTDQRGQGAWQLQRYKPFIDLAHSGRFALDAPKNKRYRTNLPVKNIPALQKPGVYLAVMRPAGSYPHAYQATYFVVSDIGLHVRFYKDRLDMYTTALASATPLAGVNVTLLDEKGDTVGQTRSSPQGFATFNGPRDRARFLVASMPPHLALLSLHGPALDLSSFELGVRPQAATEAYIYGPRDLYRPGETVIFNALLRDGDGRLAGNPPLKAVLYQPDEREAEDTVLHAETLAYYQHEYALPDDAATGQWRLDLRIGSQTVGSYRFKVEEFLPERMKLTLDDGVKKSRYTDKDKNLLVPVQGMYLYGAPAAKNRVSALLTLGQQRTPVEALRDFQFGDALERKEPERVELQDLFLDEKGEARVEAGNRWRDARSPLDVHLIASLYESGGRPVVRDIHYTVWPVEALIGIRPLFKENDLGGNTLAAFEIVKTDSAGKLYEAANLEVKLVHERRNYYWVYSDDRGWYYEYSDKHYTPFSGNLSIGRDKKAKLEVPVEWGEYRLEVRDPKTGLMSSVRFRAGWQEEGQAAANARPDRIALTLDKKNYLGGETVKLTLTPPYAGEGFIVVEGQQPLWQQRIKMPAQGVTVSIPVDKSWKRHDLYISAVVFRPSGSQAKNMPNRAVGLLHLPLNREDRKLQVRLTPQAEKVRPETTLRSRVKIDGILDKNKPVMVTVAAVDVGVLNITDFKTPDAYPWFFSPRRYGVDSRDMYGAIIDSLTGGMARQRFGGDADLSRGGKKAQSEVRIVSLFSGPIKVNAQGEADVDFALPDFNGRLRLMALAFTDQQFGATDAEVTVAAPLIAEIAMPRFLAAGDRSTMTLDVQNLSGKAQTVTVSATATEPLRLNAKPRTLTLADGAKEILSFPLTAAQAFGAGAITVNVKNDAPQGPDAIRLRRQWTLNVRPAYPAITQSKRAVLTQGAKLSLERELDDLLRSSAQVELSVSPLPPMQLNTHLHHLLTYPYGCLEQTTSSTYPWVFATPENISRLRIDLSKLKTQDIDPAKRMEYLQAGLQRIKDMQSNGGGFGLWANTDNEEHWLTAYVTDFMLDAREQGAEVDDAMIDGAMNRLLEYVNSNAELFGERWSDDVSHYRYAYRAYAAYVLSRTNRAPLGALRTMYEQQRVTARTGLPLVHLGIALINQGDARRGMDAIKEGLAKPLSPERDYYYGDYGSPVRDTALIVYLLERHKIEAEGRGNILFKLSDALKDRDYLSTQERIALFKAGAALSVSAQDAWLGELLLGRAQQTVNGAGMYTRLFDGAQLADGLEFRSQYNKNLYAQMSIAGYPSKTPPPRLNDINVTREYYDIQGKRLAASAVDGQRTLPTLKTGDLVLVHLSVSAERRLPDALLVDLLPAGLELENQNLEHAVKADQLTINGKTLSEWQRESRVKHQEYRDDRYVAAFDTGEWESVDMFYLARAVTPGTYTVPPPYVEDMYRPYIQGLGHSIADLVITGRGN